MVLVCCSVSGPRITHPEIHFSAISSQQTFPCLSTGNLEGRVEPSTRPWWRFKARESDKQTAGQALSAISCLICRLLRTASWSVKSHIWLVQVCQSTAVKRITHDHSTDIKHVWFYDQLRFRACELFRGFLMDDLATQDRNSIAMQGRNLN